MNIKVSDYIIQYIKSKGVNDVFYLPGGGCIHLVHSLKVNKMNSISMLHQQSASIAVEAYAQYTKNFGVCLVTSGPGGTNAITGCAAAWLQSTPVLFLSGQVQTKDLRNHNGNPRQFGFQQLNIVDIVKPITKYAVTIEDPNMVVYELQKAFYMMKLSDRKGPVWLDIPLDIQSSEIDLNKCIRFLPQQKQQIIDLGFIYNLQKAKKPILFLGNGIRYDVCQQKILHLIKHLNIPVLTTWKVIDLVTEEQPLYFGRPGIIAQKYANIIQQQSDCILCLGCRLDTGQIAYNQKDFGHEAIKIIIDIDENQLAKFSKMNNVIKIKADASKVIDQLLKQQININVSNWINYCNQLKNKYPVVLQQYYYEKDYVNEYVFIEELSNQLNNKDIIVVGSSGTCAQVTFQTIKMKSGQRIINTQGLGSMGFGLPAAIGVAIASNTQIICIQGDGSFSMNIQELQVIRRLNLPIKIFIFNNKGYLSIRNTQNGLFDSVYVGSDQQSGLTLCNINKMAQAFDIEYKEINNNMQLPFILDKVLNQINYAVIVQVHTDPNHKTKPRTIVQKKQNGELYTLPMEYVK